MPLLESSKLRSLFYKNLGTTSKLPEHIVLQSPEPRGRLKQRAVLKLFLDNLKWQFRRTFQQSNIESSEAYFLMGFVEAKALEAVEKSTKLSPMENKFEKTFDKWDAKDFVQEFTASPQLIILGRKNKTVEKLEEKAISELFEFYKVAKNSRENPLDILNYLANSISKLREQYLRDLRTAGRGFHKLSPLESKDILANGFNEALIFYKKPSSLESWEIEIPIFRKNDFGKFEIDRRSLVRKLENLSVNGNTIFVPFWYWHNMLNPKLKQANFDFREVNPDAIYKKHMSLQMYHINKLLFDSNGKLKSLEIISSKNLAQFTKIQVSIELLSKYFERLKNSNESQRLNYSLINDALYLEKKNNTASQKEMSKPTKLPSDLNKQSSKATSSQSEKNNVATKRLSVRQQRQVRKLQKQKEKSDKSKNFAREEVIKEKTTETYSNKLEETTHILIKKLDNDFSSGKLDQNVIKAYNRFSSLVKLQGFESLKQISGYHAERLEGHHHLFSFRMNKHYRLYVTKALHKGKKVIIALHIGKHDYDEVLDNLEQRVESLKNEFEIN